MLRFVASEEESLLSCLRDVDNLVVLNFQVVVISQKDTNMSRRPKNEEKTTQEGKCCPLIVFSSPILMNYEKEFCPRTPVSVCPFYKANSSSNKQANRTT